MAPTKRKNDAENQTQTTTTTTRVTRSSTRQATQGGSEGGTTKPVPKTKKAKPTPKQNPEPKKPKTTESEAPPHPTAAEAEAKAKDNAGNGSKTVVIEHCKQCNQFKIRAEKVKLGLEKAVSGITVIVNPEKPRRGCFEVREEGGKKFISLLEMKRPFSPMKALDMDAFISDIIDQVK